MIFYLVSADHAPMAYLTSWGPEPGSRIRALHYEDLPRIGELSPGTYIFSDLETLTPTRLKLAGHLWQHLAQAGSRVRLLNNPAHVLRRFDLLHTLYERGVNRYRVVRATESFRPLRFPVCLKYEFKHAHVMRALLRNADELRSALRYLRLRGHRLRDVLVVEFCDTSDTDGVFRKYSAFRIGDRILPRHVLFSRNWIVRRPDLFNDDFAKEQRVYLEQHPHESWLREVFTLARIEYGRIDYSLLDGEPQVWEINTHPLIRRLTPRLTTAFEAIDGVGGGDPIPILPNQALVRKLQFEDVKRRSAEWLWRVIDHLLTRRESQRLIRVVRTFRRIRWYET